MKSEELDQYSSTPGPSLTGYFLHPDLHRDPDTLQRARILIVSNYALIFLIAINLVVLIVSPVETLSLIVGLPFCLLNMSLCFWQLYQIKQNAAYDRCALMLPYMLAVWILLGGALSGGSNDSPFLQVLVVVPVMAFLFSGIRGGVMTTLFCTAGVLLMMLLEYLNIALPNLLSSQQLPVAKGLNLMIEFVAVTAFVYVYEFTSANLRLVRDKDYEKVVRLAQTDQLTGLANRRAFDERVENRVVSADGQTEGSAFSLCYVDLDGFKPINDRHGHDVGDQVLRTVSIRLRSALRGADLIGRHGGDEFMLLLDDIASEAAAEAMAKRFLKVISEPIETSAGLVFVGASFGFALYPSQAKEPETLKKYADIAMYEAKRNRLGWKIYDA